MLSLIKGTIFSWLHFIPLILSPRLYGMQLLQVYAMTAPVHVYSSSRNTERKHH